MNVTINETKKTKHFTGTVEAGHVYSLIDKRNTVASAALFVLYPKIEVGQVYLVVYGAGFHSHASLEYITKNYTIERDITNIVDIDINW